MSQPDFSIEIFQNEYLPDGGQDVNAIVTVTSGDTVAVSRHQRGRDHHHRLLWVHELPADQDLRGPSGHRRRHRCHPRRRRLRCHRGHQRRPPGVPHRRQPGRRQRADQGRRQEGCGPAAARRRDRDREVAAAGPSDVHEPRGRAAPRHPAHRRQEPAREPRPARSGHRPVRGRVQLRLPGRRHRLGGQRDPPDLHRPAGHRRHRARPLRAGRRLRGDDGQRHGQAGRRRRAARVDAPARHPAVRQAGRTHRR